MNDVDRGLHGRRRRDRELERPSECAPQVVREQHRRRICDGDEESAARQLLDGERFVLPRKVFVQSAGELEIEVVLVELDERKLVLLGDRSCDLLRRHDSALDEDLAEATPGDPLPT
jgi:hypothetical protein